MADIDSWDKTAANNNSPAPDGAPEGSFSFKQINNTIREMMAVIARNRDDTNGVLATTNSGNAYSVSLNRSTVAAYADGLMFWVRINSANTGNVTLNVNTLGAKPVVLIDGAEVPAGQWGSNNLALVAYDATNDKMVSLSPLLEYRDPLTTRGDILVRGASLTERFAIDAADKLLGSDGTDLIWTFITGAMIALGSDAQGDIIQRGASDYERLPIGTPDQVLHVNSGGGAQEYRNRPGAVSFATHALSGAGSYDWLALPGDVKRFDVWLNAASLDGNSAMLIQLGTSGGVETTGYTGIVRSIGFPGSPFSDGFRLVRGQESAGSYTGMVSITNITGDTWVVSGHIMRDDASYYMLGGSIALPGALTQMRLTSAGANLFDGGYSSLEGVR